MEPLDFGDFADNLDFLNNIDIIIAGDIIYDNDITDKFVKFLKNLSKSASPFTVYVAMEKRLQITLLNIFS